jgi:hypothetical protein
MSQLLAYLLIYSPQPQTFMAGILVINSQGLPQEFRYSDPVQAGKLQQLLYGKTLATYTKREVLVSTLLKTLESQGLELVFVTDDTLLGTYEGALGSKLSLVRLSETQMPALGKPGKVQRISSTEVLFQCTDHHAPIRLCAPAPENKSCAPPAEAEVKTSDSPNEWPSATCLQELEEASKTLDLWEPFQRVERLLEALWQESALSKASLNANATTVTASKSTPL